LQSAHYPPGCALVDVNAVDTVGDDVKKELLIVTLTQLWVVRRQDQVLHLLDLRPITSTFTEEPDPG